jgi:hypothetical protein
MPSEEVRGADGIVINEDNQFAPRHPDSGIPGLTEAAIRLFDNA